MTARAWTDELTGLLLRAVDRLADDGFGEPTALPGWTRAHLVGHVHANAEALRRLLDWAATGVENRMYPGARQRADEIEALSKRPPSELRTLVRTSADRLAADMDALPDGAWGNPVMTAQGRIVPAAEIPWMRAREMGVHAVDLGTGVTFADLPEGFCTRLASEAVAGHAARGQAADLAAWLTGRAAEPPALGPWL